VCSLPCYIKVPGTSLNEKDVGTNERGGPTRTTAVSYGCIMFTILPLVYHPADSAEITGTC
jgi:hypothetical protein